MYFLLVVTFMLSNGQKGVSTEKFDSQGECFRAMMAVSQEAPGVSAVCKEIARGM